MTLSATESRGSNHIVDVASSLVSCQCHVHFHFRWYGWPHLHGYKAARSTIITVFGSETYSHITTITNINDEKCLCIREALGEIACEAVKKGYVSNVNIAMQQRSSPFLLLYGLMVFRFCFALNSGFSLNAVSFIGFHWSGSVFKNHMALLLFWIYRLITPKATLPYRKAFIVCPFNVELSVLCTIMCTLCSP